MTAVFGFASEIFGMEILNPHRMVIVDSVSGYQTPDRQEQEAIKQQIAEYKEQWIETALYEERVSALRAQCAIHGHIHSITKLPTSESRCYYCGAKMS